MTDRTIHYFGASWCGPCNQVKKSDAWKNATETLDNLEVHDVDEEQQLANDLDVRSVPAFRIEENGMVIDGGTGPQPILELLEEEMSHE